MSGIERKAAIYAYVKSVGKATLADICEAVAHHKVVKTTVKRDIFQLREAGKLRFEGRNNKGHWVLGKVNYAKRADMAAMGVQIAQPREWLMPAQQVTMKNGVKITRQPPPPGRFEVSMPRGSGVISQDWAARRASQQG